MKAAPYNPDTLKIIRDGASAASLGWDETFYHGVCRKHGIAPVASFDPRTSVIDAPKLVEPTAPPDQPPVETPAPTGNVCVVNVALGEFRRGRAAISLTARQIAIVAVLAKAAPHEFTATVRIAAAVGVQPQSVSNYISGLRGALRHTHVLLDSAMGRGRGGYRLIDMKTRAPIRFQVVNA